MNKITQVVIVVIVAAVIIGGVWYGVSRKMAVKGVIKIGVILPLTGEAAVWGENTKSGIDLAAEETQKRFNIRVGVIYEDSQCDPAKAASAIQKLITVDKTVVVIGDVCSSATLAAAPIAEESQVVFLTPGSSADKISQAGDFIFRNYPTNAQLAQGIIKILKQLGKSRIAIMYVNNDYGVGFKDNITKEIPDEIVAIEAHDQKAVDFRTNLSKVKSQNPDAVFLASYYTDGALIMKQAKEMGINVQFVGPDAFDDPKVIEIAGEAASGMVLATVKPAGGPRFSEFENLYQNRYQKEPPFLADFGYDALMVVAEAVKSGYSDSAGIKNFLYRLRDYQGASNRISFDQNGDLINPALAFKTIKNGKFVPYEE